MWIVKLGGSLAADESLPEWLELLSDHGGGKTVLVPGGGPFADLVQDSQAYWRFGDSCAHFMALLAMSQFGLMLTGMHPMLIPVECKEDIDRVMAEKDVPVWLPTNMVTDDETIQHSWEVTSDSLAAWLATHLGFSRVILIKSIETQDIWSIDELAREGIVDPSFPEYVSRGNLSVFLIARDGFQQFINLLAKESGPAPDDEASEA